MSHTTATTTTEATPYERFLRQNLEDEKKRAEELNAKYAKANSLRKIQLKRELDLVNQNIALLTADISHYESNAVQWLREHSKERDEKAEGLKPVPIEAILGSTPASQQAKPTSPTTSVARAAPMIGKPIGSAPQAGSPSTPSSAQPATPKPTSTPRVGTPVVGKPVGTPIVGKPVGMPVVSKQVSSTPSAAPQVGTPTKKQEKEEPTKTEEKKEAQTEEKKASEASESSSATN